ncbi:MULTISPECIES: response regulator [unclassified Caballeronia]|uniref:response regulator n=1 Tax=unclassified Caballeronia TaxID=2646786 RepID=UPI001FCF8443|nr:MULTISPECIES: response regulator [unclassified Caballeronia]
MIRSQENAIAGRLSTRKVHTSAQKARVLVVDDNQHGACATSALLDADGFHVRTAFSGVEAIEILQDWMPHVILLDINMPEFDGFAVASVIRSIGATSDLGIIAMTGYDEAELRLRGSLDAFDGYFRRGDSELNLVALLEDIVEE